jgi:hypothetical protein
VLGRRGCPPYSTTTCVVPQLAITTNHTLVAVAARQILLMS